MDTIRKLLFISGVLTLFEVVVYKMVIRFGDWLYPLNEIGVSWPIYEFYSLGLLIYFIFLVNFVLSLMNIKKLSLFVIFGLLAIYIYLVHEPYETRPLRVLLRILLATCFTCISLFVVYRWNNKVNQEPDSL
ncbi:hypothetical protein H7U19_14460 [Hyunsoonleella sp. SJ7]|uniref:Uncharacterized protein n=1 Tax=Hyunsoonleella aquatilis TaxID=2762758 RepID=A0A923HHW7_9FLAO|nr:hypothetical protein [Hyunsoonleella aquatilis]MBC3759615.1 hypothetical protein [Hyunsoonleella aquatilis]